MANRKKITLKEAYAKDGKFKEQQVLKMLKHKSEEEGSTRGDPSSSPMDLRLGNLLRRKRKFPDSPLDLRVKRVPSKTRCYGRSEEDKKFLEISDRLPVIKTDSFASKALTASDDQREAALEMLKGLITELKKSKERYSTTRCRLSTDTLIKCGPNCLIPSGIPHESDDATNKLMNPPKTKSRKLDELSTSSKDFYEPNVVRRCNSLPAFPTFKRQHDGYAPTTASCRAVTGKLWHELTVMNSFVAFLANNYSRTKLERESVYRVPPADNNGFIQYYSDFPDEEEEHGAKIKKLETLDFMFLKNSETLRTRKRESEVSSSRGSTLSSYDFGSLLPNFVRKVAELIGLVDIRSDKPEDHPPGYQVREEYTDEAMEDKPMHNCAQQ